MKVKLFIILFLLVSLCVSSIACGGIDFGYLRENANNNNQPNEGSINNGENNSETPDTTTNDEIGNAEDSGFGGSDGDELLIIEIIENRIIFNNEDITLTELESIILEYIDSNYVWEIHDTHKASKAVYDDVIDLFNENGVAFRELQD